MADKLNVLCYLNKQFQNELSRQLNAAQPGGVQEGFPRVWSGDWTITISQDPETGYLHMYYDNSVYCVSTDVMSCCHVAASCVQLLNYLLKILVHTFTFSLLEVKSDKKSYSQHQACYELSIHCLPAPLSSSSYCIFTIFTYIHTECQYSRSHSGWTV